MNNVIKAQTLHLGPIIESLEEFLVTFIYKLLISSFRHLFYINMLYAKLIKIPCKHKSYREF
nr:MAG TPA: hypothetical protein [Caudoviricetes sp.]